MIITKIVDEDHPIEFTEEEIALTEKAKQLPVVPDDENPELTDEELSQMVPVGTLKYEECLKTVTIRLSRKTLQKAKSFGKGYTSLLSRILEDVLNDNDKLKKYL